MPSAVGRGAERYARFARDEAPGRSRALRRVGSGRRARCRRAADPRADPRDRRQPPLVFAVTRMLGAPEAAFAAWARVARRARRRGRRRGIRARSLQTNEPQRCAALLPALEHRRRPDRAARGRRERGAVPLPRPLLVPLSAAAPISTRPAESLAVVLAAARSRGDTAAADARGRVAGGHRPRAARCRATPADRRFLTTLVWPGETGRAERIEAALDIVAADPPVHRSRGDASDPAVLGSRRRPRAGGCDARGHDAGRAAAHPARRPRAADRDAGAASTPSGSRSIRRGCTMRGIPPSIRRVGRVRARRATAFRSPPSTRSALSWSGARGIGVAAASVSACPSPTATAPSSTSKPSGGATPARRKRRSAPTRHVAGALLPAARSADRHRRRAGARPDARQAPAPPARRPRGRATARPRRALTPRGTARAPPVAFSGAEIDLPPGSLRRPPGRGPRRCPPGGEPPHARMGRAAVGGARDHRARRRRHLRHADRLGSHRALPDSRADGRRRGRGRRPSSTPATRS